MFDPEVIGHVRAIDRRFHTLIRDTIHEQLEHQPNRPTRNRKPLTRETRFGMVWELRFGPANRFRAFYRVVAEENAVWVLAVLVKVGNKLYMGGQEVEL